MAAKVVDFAKISTSLNLSKETLSSLSGFRARHSAAKAAVASLKSQKQTVDFEHYRQTLKNQEVVSKIEKLVTGFKPKDYDVQAQIKAIEAFEGKAVAEAEQATVKVEGELQSLNETLQNIEGARPFDQLTLADIDKAEPKIQKTVDTMMSKGKWTVDGYDEKFGNLSVM